MCPVKFRMISLDMSLKIAALMRIVLSCLDLPRILICLPQQAMKKELKSHLLSLQQQGEAYTW